MSTLTIVLLVILVVLIAALIALYFFGKKAQKKQEEQQAQIEAKAEVSGLYIVGVKGIRGSLETPAPKKKGFFKRLLNK